MINRYSICLITLTVCVSFFSASAQIFQKNADDFPEGVYTRDQLLNDWNTTFGNGFSRRGEGEDRVSVVASKAPDGLRALKVKYPKDQVDSKNSGAQWETNLNGGYEDLYLSYDMMFSDDFELVKPGPETGRTGKLPGLAGGLSVDDKDDANTAWDGKLQFRDKDELEFNVKTPLNNLKHFTWLEKAYTIPKGKWFNIEIRYKLNTVGRKDGIMQGWIDGQLLGEYTNAEFRDDARVKINKMFFSTFYGGNFENDAPTKDVYAYFDNFVVDNQRINKPVGAPDANSPVPVLSVFSSDFIKKSEKIYPNPSSDGVFNLATATNWEVFNLSGKLIATGNNKEVALFNVPNGIYILKINDTIQKIVVGG